MILDEVHGDDLVSLALCCKYVSQVSTKHLVIHQKLMNEEYGVLRIGSFRGDIMANKCCSHPLEMLSHIIDKPTVANYTRKIIIGFCKDNTLHTPPSQVIPEDYAEHMATLAQIHEEPLRKYVQSCTYISKEVRESWIKQILDPNLDVSCGPALAILLTLLPQVRHIQLKKGDS